MPAVLTLVRELISRFPVLAFVALVVAISGGTFGLARLVPGAESPERLPGALLWLPIVWSPNLAAALVTWARGDLRDLLGRFARWRVPFVVLLGASLPVAIFGLVALLAPHAAHFERLAPRTLLLLAPLHLLLGPLGEEAGWRGFLQPELDARWGRWRAALAVGAIWALWHLPLWTFDSPQAQIPFGLFAAHVFAYTFALSALVSRAGGSVVPAVLFHWLVNLTTALAEIVELASAAVWFTWTLPLYAVGAAWLYGAFASRGQGRGSGFGRGLRAVGILLLVALGSWLLAYVLAPPRVAPVLDPSGRPAAGHVATIERPVIGGVPQAVVLRGRSETLPLVLFVHGGPGTPETPMLLELAPELTDHVLLASWEQRGAGMSFTGHVPAESLDIATMTRDLQEVTEWLLERQGHERLLLMAHSWGTVLALHAIAERPDLYAGYVAIGQVAQPAESEHAIYAWALAEANRRGDRKALTDLEDIGPPENGDYREGVKGRARLGRWITRWGGSLHGRSDLYPFICAVARTPAYGFWDRIQYLRGETFSLRQLWHEMQAHDLTRAVTRVEIPVWFVHGRYDRQTPLEPARRYFDQLSAPSKQFVLFDQSAHSPIFEEPERFLELLRDEVLPAASWHAPVALD